MAIQDGNCFICGAVIIPHVGNQGIAPELPRPATVMLPAHHKHFIRRTPNCSVPIQSWRSLCVSECVILPFSRPNIVVAIVLPNLSCAWFSCRTQATKDHHGLVPSLVDGRAIHPSTRSTGRGHIGPCSCWRFLRVSRATPKANPTT